MHGKAGEAVGVGAAGSGRSLGSGAVAGPRDPRGDAGREGSPYTTILSVLQVLEKKGLVRHTRQGQANVYHPKLKRGQVLAPLMKDLLPERVRRQPGAWAAQSLLDGAEVKPGDLDEIRKVIEQAENGVKREEGGA